MKLLKEFGYLYGNLQRNKVLYHTWKQRCFHTNSCLLDQAKFNDKPLWFKKFKLKQAAMQKDDGRPTFLKKGIPDKILFNLTLALFIFGMVWSFKVVAGLDKPNNK